MLYNYVRDPRNDNSQIYAISFRPFSLDNNRVNNLQRTKIDSITVYVSFGVFFFPLLLLRLYETRRAYNFICVGYKLTSTLIFRNCRIRRRYSHRFIRCLCKGNFVKLCRELHVGIIRLLYRF